MSSTSMEWVTFTAKRFNWKSFSIIVVRHTYTFFVELFMWRIELKQITIVRLRPICKLSLSSGDNFQIISEMAQWSNEQKEFSINCRKRFNLTFFSFLLYIYLKFWSSEVEVISSEANLKMNFSSWSFDSIVHQTFLSAVDCIVCIFKIY